LWASYSGGKVIGSIDIEQILDRAGITATLFISILADFSDAGAVTLPV
jgi:hypothetical protein